MDGGPTTRRVSHDIAFQTTMGPQAPRGHRRTGRVTFVPNSAVTAGPCFLQDSTQGRLHREG